MIKGETKKKGTDYVNAFHNDYIITIGRHPRFNWVTHSDKDYMYFLYITRTEKNFVGKNTAHVGKFNILCHQQTFYDYHHLMLVIEPILSEYILESKKIFKICMLVQELEYQSEDPLSNKASGE